MQLKWMSKQWNKRRRVQLSLSLFGREPTAKNISMIGSIDYSFIISIIGGLCEIAHYLP